MPAIRRSRLADGSAGKPLIRAAPTAHVRAGVAASPTEAFTDPSLQALGAGRALRPSEVPIAARGYGHDFGRVRVHDDDGAHAAAAALDASAFTWGEHIVLSVNPRRDALAHELAHVVQQQGAVGIGPTGPSGALEQDAELAAASGRAPQLRANRQLQRQPALGKEGLNQAEQATLTDYLFQHGFYPVGAGLAKFDGNLVSSDQIARRAGAEAMQQSVVSLIKKDVDRRIMNAVLWRTPPPAPRTPQTPGQKVEDWLTRKPDGGGGQQLPPSVAPNPADLNKTTSTPIPGDQSMFKRAGIPLIPSQSPPIALPQPGKDSALFRYDQLQSRYATGTGIAFQITPPAGFWKQSGAKQVVLQASGATQPLISQEISRDGQPVTWAVPPTPGGYTILVTVDGQPLSASVRTIQVYAPSSATPSPPPSAPGAQPGR